MYWHRASGYGPGPLFLVQDANIKECSIPRLSNGALFKRTVRPSLLGFLWPEFQLCIIFNGCRVDHHIIVHYWRLFSTDAFTFLCIFLLKSQDTHLVFQPQRLTFANPEMIRFIMAKLTGILHWSNMISAIQTIGRRHTKRYPMAWVIVIPKEGCGHAHSSFRMTPT